MPQMMPLMWLPLYISVSMLMLTAVCCTYFLYTPHSHEFAISHSLGRTVQGQPSWMW